MPSPLRTLATLTLTLTLTLALAASAVAGDKTVVPTIVSVAADSITVKTGRHAGLKSTAYDAGGTVPGASNIETYRTTTTTGITVNGLKATLADLQPGMRVSVTQGLDRKTAATISATVIPPPQATPTPHPGWDKGKSPKRIFTAIDACKVIALGADTITVSQDGGAKTQSFKVGKITTILVNGKPADLGKVSVGMKVIVVAGLDPTVAGRITASDE